MYKTLIILILCSILLPAEDSFEKKESFVQKELKGFKKAIKQLKVEINFYNLINGLHLTKKQIQKIIFLSKKVKKLKETYLKPKKSLSSLKYELVSLQRLKDCALKGQEIPDWMARMHQTQLRGRRKKKPNRQRFIKESKKLEVQLNKILTNTQKEVISTYKPCLIPPKDLKNPVRVGQAENTSGLVKTLGKLRKLNDPFAIYIFMEKAMYRIEKKQGKYKKDERKSIMNKWYSLIEKTKSLSDTDFELAKDELAKVFHVKDRKKELRAIIDKSMKKKKLPGKAARFLLDPRIIPVLEKRLHQMITAKQKQATDLTKIEKAENCDDGQCGIRD